MAKLTSKKYNIANLRSTMDDDKTRLAERRRAATKLYELGALSEADFNKFLPRSASESPKTSTSLKADK
jgi:hypothetical protein